MSDTEKGVKWLFIFLILIVIAFGIGLFVRNYLQSEHQREYNGFLVTPVQSGNIVTYKVDIYINAQPFVMNARYAPWQVDDIPIDPNVASYLTSKKELIGAIDANDPRLFGATTVAALEVNNIMEGIFNINMTSASTTPHDKFKLISCADATKDVGVVIFEIGERDEVVMDNSCVRVRAKEEPDLVKSATRVNYALTGIIP